MASKTVIITTWRSLTSYLLNSVKIHFPVSVQLSTTEKLRTISLVELDHISTEGAQYDTEPELSIIEKGIYTTK